MEYRTLREWLTTMDALGEIKTVRGVHWDREMGAMVDMVYPHQGAARAVGLAAVSQFTAVVLVTWAYWFARSDAQGSPLHRAFEDSW